jgi:hypothetical protein
LDAIVDTRCRDTRTARHGFLVAEPLLALETSQSSLTIPVTLALPLAFSEKTLVWRQPKILQVWLNVRRIVTVVRLETKGPNAAGYRFKEQDFETLELAHTVRITLTKGFAAFDWTICRGRSRKTVHRRLSGHLRRTRFSTKHVGSSCRGKDAVVAIVRSFDTRAGTTWNCLNSCSFETRQTIGAIGMEPAVTLAFTEGVGFVKHSVAHHYQLTLWRLVTIVKAKRTTTRTTRYGFKSLPLETIQSQHTVRVTLASPLAFTVIIQG